MANKEEEQNKRYKKIRCTFCESGQTYFKIREQIWQCRSCGEKFEFNRSKLGHPHTEETKKILSEKFKENQK